MQKISRIYLGNCGFDTAWFDGVLLDLRDNDWRAPSDVVINLENGGGKTTLLSLIFSCFETSQDRFLKHLQSKNSHFSQYFSNDGSLAVILVEWDMEPRRAGDSRYKVVIGQAVAVLAQSEKTETERIFFSFTEDAALSLEDVPAPKLSDSPLASLGDFSRWLQEQQRASPGNLYYTRNQRDWRQHLESRHIDVEMLRMQVDFSVTEGGFDSGFLNFRSELEFLRKFFALTLEPQRAASVRTAVATACDKLRRKPQFEQRLGQLQAFQAVMQSFAQSATALQTLDELRLSSRYESALLSRALEESVLKLRQQATSDEAFAAVQFGVARTAEAGAKSALELHAGLTARRLGLARTRAQEELEQAKKAHEQAEKDILHLRAAKLALRIGGLKKQQEEKEELTRIQSAELKPYQDEALRQGGLLRQVLFAAARSRREEAQRIRGEIDKRKAALREIADKVRAFQGEKQSLVREQASLEALAQQQEQGRRDLLADGTLVAPETGAQAAERWASHRHVLAEQMAYLEQQLEQLKGQRVTAARELERLRLELVTTQRELDRQQSFVAQGLAEQERLSQHPGLTAAAETEQVTDLDSVGLKEQLQRRLLSFGAQVAEVDVRLAQLQADRQAVEDTGVAGCGSDVSLVVRELQSRGIRSARPFGQYLAETLADAQRVRALVESDPARFAGVCVASAEMAAVRALNWGPTALPSRAVVVSVASLEPEAQTAVVRGQQVVPAQTDAAYNREAAQALLQRVQQAVLDEQGTRQRLQAARDEAADAQSQLKSFQRVYGEGRLRQAAQDVERLATEVHTLTEGIRRTQEQDAAWKQEEIDLGQQQRRVAHEDKTAEGHERMARRHADQYEAHEAQRNSRLQALAQRAEELKNLFEELDESAAGLEAQNEEAQPLAAGLDAQAGSLDEERGRIRHAQTGSAVEEALRAEPRTLEELRGAYARAVTLLETNERGRLGALQVQLDGLRAQIEQDQQEFARDFPGVTNVDMRPFGEMDIDATLASRKLDLPFLRSQEDAARDKESKASAEFSSWPRMNKVALGSLLPEHLDMTPEQLEAAAVQALEAHQEESARAVAAKKAAEDAKGRAARLTSEAQTDATLLNTFNATLELGTGEVLEREIMELGLRLTAVGQSAVLERGPLVLQLNHEEQVRAQIEQGKRAQDAFARQEKVTKARFDELRRAAMEPQFLQAEPDIGNQLSRNEFESAVSDVQRLLAALADRIDATNGTLQGMRGDFEAAAEELHALTQGAISTLNSALRKNVPSAAPLVGGKPILKMRSALSSITADERRRVLQNYLDRLIETNVLPATGTDLAADALLAVNGRALGLQVLKMSIDTDQQYVAIDKVSNSGGEGVVMAMFLYLLVNQLRAEMQAKEHRGGGGPLLLDNPFGKATLATMWRAQRELAESIGVQLIFTTAIQDYNTLAEFGRFLRLRRAGQNSRTRRWHLEAADFQIHGRTELPEQKSLLLEGDVS